MYLRKLSSYGLHRVPGQMFRHHLGMRTGKPDSIVLEITHRCNSRCAFCYYWKTEKGYEMDMDEINKAVSSLKRWLGHFQLVISGGEPLLRATDVCELLSFLEKEKIGHLLCTNAIALDEKLADRLLKAGLTDISISLNSLDKKEHDASRGIEGSFEKAIKAIQFLKDRALVSLDTVIYQGNADGIVDIAKYARKNRLDSVYYNLVQPRKASADGPVVWDEAEKARAVDSIRTLRKMKTSGYPISNTIKTLKDTEAVLLGRKNELGCLCGVRRFAVLPDGSVKLCARKSPVGNILEKKPETIWNGQSSDETRRQIKACKDACDPTGGLSCTTRKSLIVDGLSLVRRNL